MWRFVAALTAALMCSGPVRSTEYVTLDPPPFEQCMLGCDDTADQCFANDSLDENGIELCEETKTNCYRRCANREIIRRAKKAGHNLKCVIA